VEDLANEKVLENALVHAVTMNRAEAEEKYRKAPVNGTPRLIHAAHLALQL
jgi:hypothetical protein